MQCNKIFTSDKKVNKSGVLKFHIMTLRYMEMEGIENRKANYYSTNIIKYLTKGKVIVYIKE